MRAQHANEDERPIVVVDPERNYVFANEAACRLVGFDHAQFMELRIDDLVVGKSQVAGPLFERFVPRWQSNWSHQPAPPLRPYPDGQILGRSS